MIEPDPAQLHQVFRLEPDRKPAMIERLVAEIADPDTRDLEPMLVGIERADRFAKYLADAVAAVGTGGHIGADMAMARVEADGVVRRRKHDALDAFAPRRLEQV